MSGYQFRDIEKKWQSYWKENKTFKTTVDKDKPKYYILDMFPYPSGAGLHVGHPLGYIASDIISRYKKLKGFNVLHPMGFDSFGLPAEQYAIQTGQHPAVTTEENITRYKEQLENIGFSYDWDREIRTSDPSYYKWTQWIFIQLFHSWYNNESQKAEPIESLISSLEKEGNASIKAACDEDTPIISAQEWNEKSEADQQTFLLKYRLTYLSETMVNWCPVLGTVLANDEVKDGLSERGGHPVERKKMQQWSMRITAYANRLLKGLNDIDWSDSIKEIQKNWIGKSYGCSLKFKVVDQEDIELEVFTTRPDTSFGVTYVSIAPEHELVQQLTTPAQTEAVKDYVEKATNKSERERMSDTKTVDGVFTGSYVINPFNGEKVQLWIAEYVLAGYGSGVVMAVPSSDTRDYAFATHFGLPIIPVQEGPNTDISQDDFNPKAGKMINSGFLDGMKVKAAIPAAIQYAQEHGFGEGKVNFKLRDAIFSRQRYWGEPIPIYFKDNIPYTLPTDQLPLELPEVDEYLPTEDGQPPLGRAKDWTTADGHPLEMNTMPGWAGSSWYFYSYMDANQKDALVDPSAENYWKNVDLYLGGAEHATGHLLYSRFWNMFLFDRGFVSEQDVFKKLVNQGMIQGRSSLVYRINGTNKFVSKGLKDDYETTPIHTDVSIVQNDMLDVEAFKAWRPDFKDAEFVLEDGQYHCGFEVEKMSKRWFNVVNPDDIVEKYGADTLRLYEMFLGPIEQSKPWNTNGIDGSFKFLRKLWYLCHDQNDTWSVSDEKPTKEDYKALHETIKKTIDDIERLSLNTCVSNFMIGLKELSSLKCNKREIIEELIVLISPFAPHICEELWEKLGHSTSVSLATYPEVNESYLQEDAFEYPISINGKMRTKIEFPLDMPKEDIQKAVLANEIVQKWTEGNEPKKIIIVPNRIVNLVV